MWDWPLELLLGQFTICLERTRSKRDKGGFTAEIQVPALTAAAIQDCRDKCLQAGMDDFLPKPVKLEDLMAALERHLPVRIGRYTDPSGLVRTAQLPTEPYAGTTWLGPVAQAGRAENWTATEQGDRVG
jgi:DNA-binding response OmpR family regulator